MKKILILTCILFVLTINVYSEWDQRAAKYTISTCLYKDGMGYFGRTNGLTILDFQTGKIRNLSTVNSALPGNYINSILEISDNTLLIATNAGLAQIENGAITKNNSICKDYPDNDSRKLIKDKEGNLWTFSAHKVHKYKNGKWTSYDLGAYIKSKIGISKLYCFDNEVWLLSNEIPGSSDDYYYPLITTNNYNIAILRDTGIVKVFQSITEYPYSVKNMSLAEIKEGVLLWNGDSVNLYRNEKWERTNLLDQSEYNQALIVNDFLDDNKGNIWYALSQSSKYYGNPVCYNKETGKKTEYIKEQELNNINIIDTLENGEIYFCNSNLICFNKSGTWITKSISDLGLPNITAIADAFLIGNKKYINIYFTNFGYKSGKFLRGDFICLDDTSKFRLDENIFPYSGINSFGISKDQKGMFSGIHFDEVLRYEADSAFARLPVPIIPPEIKSSSSGNVYYYYPPDIVTWNGNNVKYLGMGYPAFSDNKVIDFDINGDLVIALGYYEYTKDSLSTFVSIYNSKTGKTENFDRNNSPLPDFYRIDKGGYYVFQDTVPTCVTTDDKSNVWIKTSTSLIKFNKGNCTNYELPKNLPGFSNFYFDKTTNQIVVNSIEKINYYDIKKNIWDNIPISNSNIKGKPDGIKSIKKLSNNNVYASDDLGYFYQYIGNGKFNMIDLQLPYRDNLGTGILDFCVDANNYLHFGTLAGIFTNKYIFNCGNDNFNFPDFYNSSDLILNGKSQVSNYAIKLTDSKINEANSLFYKKPAEISGGFTSEFSFRFFNGFNNDEDGSPAGADGITFIIQANNPNVIGNGGGGLGYDGIPNSFVIEFDSYKNNAFSDPDGSHVAIFTNGKDLNSAKHNSKSDLGTSSTIPILKADSTVYYSKIEYDYESKKMSVWLDTTNNFKNPVLVANAVDLSKTLNLIDNNKAYIGFTSATGESYQNTELLSWSFCPVYYNPIISSVEETDYLKQTDVCIYPNPAQNYLYIKTSEFNDINEIRLFDMLGTNIIISLEKNLLGSRIDISNLSSGIYLIKIGNKFEKFVKI